MKVKDTPKRRYKIHPNESTRYTQMKVQDTPKRKYKRHPNENKRYTQMNSRHTLFHFTLFITYKGM